MISSHVDQRVFSQLMEDKLPALSSHLKLQDVQLPLVTTHWFLCIFVNSLPTEAVLRVWDVFLHEGSKVLFRVALALIKVAPSCQLQLT